MTKNMESEKQELLLMLVPFFALLHLVPRLRVRYNRVYQTKDMAKNKFSTPIKELPV